MCFWKKKTITNVVTTNVTTSNVTPTLTLPHPQEPMNPVATKDTVNLAEVLNEWFSSWGVVDKPFWGTVAYELVDGLGCPAQSYAQSKKVQIDPPWANPGIIAHESAHISYSLLTDAQKQSYQNIFNLEKDTDDYIKLLHSQNTYMDTSIVEAHAEIYRYIGDKMPNEMKSFYPHLL